MRARLLPVLVVVGLVARAEAGQVGWSVTPPEGWVRDEPAGEALRDQTRRGFFSGTRVEIDGAVYHAPDHRAVLAVQVIEVPRGELGGDVLDAWARRLAPEGAARHRRDGARDVVDIEHRTEDTVARAHLAVAHGDTDQAIAVVCTEPATGTACAPTLAAVRYGEPAGAPTPWGTYVAVAGAALIGVGFVGWLRSRKR